MPKTARTLKFNEALLEAADQLMQTDPDVYLMGLGVPDPKGIFGTTLGLGQKYGSDRVMDMPTSENAMTGIAIGSALMGMKPIMTHQRVDFFLLALDQLINNAAKWNEMFDGAMQVPLVIRLIVGRGWGQGPQHSQSLHSLFAHIPGLKVVAPSNAFDAKGLLVSAVKEQHPVVFLEHRWLHNISGQVPEEMYEVEIGKAKVIREGSALTIIASSHMTLEAHKAVEFLNEDIEIVDLRTLSPLDKETILNSTRKTGRVLIADGDWKTCGLAAEISSIIVEGAFNELKMAPKRVTFPDYYCPTSWTLSNHFYPTAKDIAIAALEMLGKDISAKKALNEILKLKMSGPLDVPDASFTGPF